jgi:predicted enzyme related to lactoylglutathione lyase
MSAKINHLAILSENYTRSAMFYETMFGMTAATSGRRERAITVGDGYVGLNINPRNVARPARLDHFGFQVEDAERVFERMKRIFPEVAWLKRPASRPYAGVTTHDPDGNVFDLSQLDMTNRHGLYVEQEGTPIHPRYVSHFGLRTLHPQTVADFYRDVFDLKERMIAGTRNRYLTDGHVTLVVLPWHITDYDGTGIVAPCLDHIGFTVENLAQFNQELEEKSSRNRQLIPFPVGSGPEGAARLDLARRSCPLCEQHLADVDGVLLSVGESVSDPKVIARKS